MKRLKLDQAAPSVKRFVRSLSVGSEDVEIELNGRVVCKIVSPLQLSEAEKKALVAERWALIHHAAKRSRGIPARVISREIDAAVAEVRRKRR